MSIRSCIILILVATAASKADEAHFFGYPTLTLVTTTKTSTATTSSTCTTSTATLNSCSPFGLRRSRGIVLTSKKRRPLLYSDNSEPGVEDWNIFLPKKFEVKEVAPLQEPAPIAPVTPAVATLVPFVIEPGFDVSKELRGVRQLIKIATRTVTTTTTTTAIISLTAVCFSSTGLASC